MIEVNLKSAFRFIQAVAKGGASADRGRSQYRSISGFCGPKTRACIYRNDQGPRHHDDAKFLRDGNGPRALRVNAIAPGLVQVRRLSSGVILEGRTEAAPDPTSSQSSMSGPAAEIAEIAVMWPVDLPLVLTGPNAVVDGGRLLP